jgi:hypothetical protein
MLMAQKISRGAHMYLHIACTMQAETRCCILSKNLQLRFEIDCMDTQGFWASRL